MHILKISILLICCALTMISSAQLEVMPLVSKSVDLKNKEVKTIYDLWTNYLGSNPNSVIDNPYWSAADKKAHKDFDLSRAMLYQRTALPLQQHLPFIEQIVKDGDHYLIETIYGEEGFDSLEIPKHPWCTQRLLAVKENERWLLKSPLDLITKNWTTKTFELVEYHYQESHIFDRDQVDQAMAFSEYVLGTFQTNLNGPIQYYVTEDKASMNTLLGLTFAKEEIKNAYSVNNIVITANGKEFDARLLVNQLIPQNGSRHPLLNKGTASIMGDTQTPLIYKEELKKFANDYFSRDSLTFEHFVTRNMPKLDYDYYYVGGSVLIKLMLSSKKIVGLKKLLAANTVSTENLLTELAKGYGMNIEKLGLMWEKELRKSK